MTKKKFDWKQTPQETNIRVTDLQIASDEGDSKSSNADNLEKKEHSVNILKEMGDFQDFTQVI